MKTKDLTVTLYEDWLNQNCYKNPTCSKCIMEKRPIATTCSTVGFIIKKIVLKNF